MHGNNKWVLLFISGFTLAGCCRMKRGYTPPKPQDLVEEVRKRNARTRSLKAVVKADQFTDKGRVKLKVFLLVKKGGKLRFEATVVDNTVAVLASNGVRFTSIDFKKHVVYEGPASPCNISRVFNIPLTGEQVAVVLMGGVPLLNHDEVSLKWDDCKGREVLRLRNKETGIVQKIYLRKRKGLWQIVGTRIKDKKGKTLLKLFSREFRRRAGVWVARWIHYVHPRRKADLLMRFKSQKLNVEIPEDAFSLNPPQGLKRRWLECPPLPRLPFESLSPDQETKKLGDAGIHQKSQPRVPNVDTDQKGVQVGKETPSARPPEKKKKTSSSH